MKFFSLLLILFPMVAFSQIKLPAIFGDDMVLQQKAKVAIWGWATAGEQVQVQGSWMAHAVSTKADATGAWKAQIETPSAGTGFTLAINERTLRNVAIGEVWICSGQSNMEWMPKQGIDYALREKEAAHFPHIRLFTVQRNAQPAPQTDVIGKWSPTTPESMFEFSAVAYFFGRKLHQELGVPIGLISTAWGGTAAEAWMSQSVLNAEPAFSHLAEAAKSLRKDEVFPTSLYNGMIAPLIPFGMAGAIWYQGESNTNNPRLYRKIFPALIQNWRTDWGHNFPFYYVQIAPYNYDLPYVGALVQEAQRMTLTASTDVGMVVTTDIGNPKDIHPQNKQEVGKRLALWALAKTYKKPITSYSGPLYKNMRIEGNKIRVFFDEFDGKLAHPFPLNSFEIAGANKHFYPATAELSGRTMLVYSAQVPQPVAVRFGFNNIAEPNFRNRQGLPASPFRTDDWALVTGRVLLKPQAIQSGNNTEYKAEMVLASTVKNAKHRILYTLDGTEPLPHASQTMVYDKPFAIVPEMRLKTRLIDEEGNLGEVKDVQSRWHLASFKAPELKHSYHAKYDGGGGLGLTDGLNGTSVFSDGRWQGFEGQDFEAVLDLQKEYALSRIETHFLEDQNAWIFLPSDVQFFISTDGISYEKVFSLQKDTALKVDKVATTTYKTSLEQRNARYIKVVARNIGTCPAWHSGAGGKSWLFVDELIVE